MRTLSGKITVRLTRTNPSMAQSPDTIAVPVYGMTCGRCEAKVSESIMALGTDLSVVAEREHDRVTVVGAVDAYQPFEKQ